MKQPANTLGILVFTAIAGTAFAWMVKRPPVEAQIMQFGMPMQAAAEKEVVAKETPEIVEEKPAEAPPAMEEKAEVEKVMEKVEEAADAVEKPAEGAESGTK